MSEKTNGTPAGADLVPGIPDGDLLILLALITVVAPGVAVIGLGKWVDVCHWCVDHSLLVDHGAIVALPCSGGIGLDLARLVLLAIAVVTVGCGGYYVRRQLRTARIERLAKRGRA